jgi:hypothetical protein
VDNETNRIRSETDNKRLEIGQWLADAQGKGEDMMKLMELHRQGHLMSPIPTLALPETENSEEE